MPDHPIQTFPRYGWILILVMSTLYVCFAMHLPVDMLPGAGHDDGWFFEKARQLVAGKWWGPFSEMTLIKGPGYSFFLAANYVLGVPVTLSQALFYAFACALFSLAVLRLSRSTPLSLAIFLLMLWHPGVLPTRLIRDDIYGGQGLIFFACLIHLLFLPLATRARIVWAVAAGLSFGWLWMTREEGVWILPATAILCGARIWQDRALLRPAGVFVATAIFAWSFVAAGNLIAYHTFTVVDFKSKAYNGALTALQSVRVGEPVAYVPVPAKVRAQIYAVSPAFASLRSFFDDSGTGWTKPGCQLYPTTCGDYAGGWFIWALRDAAARQGHYSSAHEAAAFYNRISSEVKAGCRSGRLHCATGLIDLMPAITPSQQRSIPGKLTDLKNLVLARSPPPIPSESWGTAMQLEAISDFEGYPRRTTAASDPPKTLAGWFYGKSNAWLQLHCSDDGREWVAPITRLPSPDIALHFNDPTATDRRFSADLPPRANCSFQLAGAIPSDAGLPLDSLIKSRTQTLEGNQLFIDTYGGLVRDVVDRYAHRAESVLSALYTLLIPTLAVLAALAYLAHLVQIARGGFRWDGYWLLCHALWLAIVCRLTILLLVDISSFPGISTLYIGATLPLVCAALLLTIYLPFRQSGPPRWSWVRARFTPGKDVVGAVGFEPTTR